MTAAVGAERLYEISNVRRVYSRGGIEVAAVNDVSLQINAGELVAIEGTSGSGKSTLLALLGGLDRPSSGSITFDGRELSGMDDRELTALRANAIGFIFQGFNLIPTLSARQNVEAVMAPLHLSGAAQRQRALELLDRVGLGLRADHLPSTLSGGEQQRVAVARALANGPRVVLADEPTGNLDTTTANEVVQLLRSLTDDLGVTIVLVTHDRELARLAPRRIAMRDGRIVGAPIVEAAAPMPAVVTTTRRLALVTDTEAAVDVRSADNPRHNLRAAAFIGRAAAVIALAGTGIVAVHQASTGAPAAHTTTASGASGASATTTSTARPSVTSRDRGDALPARSAHKTHPTSHASAPANHGSASSQSAQAPATSQPAINVNAGAVSWATTTVRAAVPVAPVTKPHPAPKPAPKPTPLPIVVPTPDPTPTPTTDAQYGPYWPFGGSSGLGGWIWPIGGQGSGQTG